MRPLSTRLVAALVVALALATHAPPARADGDPASDVLLGQNVFYPYAPNAVPAGDKAALNAMAAAAAKRGYPIKIAVIAAAGDLGSVSQLLTRPQAYADLLTAEISPGGGTGAKPVLVVLPSGIGGNHLGDQAGTALQDITVDDNGGASGLARTAMRAVGALTKAAGRPVPVPAIAGKAASRAGGGGGGGGPSPLLIFGLPVALVVAAAAAAGARGRRTG